jgi:hypothetical protein
VSRRLPKHLPAVPCSRQACTENRAGALAELGFVCCGCCTVVRWCSGRAMHSTIPANIHSDGHGEACESHRQHRSRGSSFGFSGQPSGRASHEKLPLQLPQQGSTTSTLRSWLAVLEALLVINLPGVTSVLIESLAGTWIFLASVVWVVETAPLESSFQCHLRSRDIYVLIIT